MAPEAVIFDCEFLTVPAAPQRFWCGPRDPDPVIAQIGAVKLALDETAEIGVRFERVVQPPLRGGGEAPLPAFFSKLTGVTEARMRAEGVPLPQALSDLADFAGSAPLWSWGKDEFHMLAISCYVAGVAPPLPVTRFGNAARVMLHAGVPEEVIVTLRSNTLLQHFGLAAGDGATSDPSGPGNGTPATGAHDALGDALSVALTLQHLIRDKQLDPAHLRDPLQPPPA